MTPELHVALALEVIGLIATIVSAVRKSDVGCQARSVGLLLHGAVDALAEFRPQRAEVGDLIEGAVRELESFADCPRASPHYLGVLTRADELLLDRVEQCGDRALCRSRAIVHLEPFDKSTSCLLEPVVGVLLHGALLAGSDLFEELGEVRSGRYLSMRNCECATYTT